MPFPRSLPRLMAIALASTEIMCGGSSPTSAPTTPLPTIAPAPPTNPVPTPLPPLSASCTRLGAGAKDARCPFEQASFQTEVDQAIATIRSQRPELFDGIQVLSTGQFIIGVIKNLDAMGVCAGWDGEELAVKNSDAFNDQYDILTANNTLRFGKGSYRTTCYPAAWPLDGKQPVPTAGCNLPPSVELTCGREVGRFLADVDAAIETALKQHPEFFDFNDKAALTDNPKILNMDGYVNFVIGQLTPKGYCARWDGTELQIKNTSNFNEQYAIVLSDGWVRRGEGAYRSTCWPSAF